MANKDNNQKNYHPQEFKYAPVIQYNAGEIKPEEKSNKPDTLFLYFTVVIAISPMLITGSVIGWSSPAVVKLTSNDTNINPLRRPITASEISLLMGVPGIISLLGTSILPKLADVIGRKRSMLVMCFATFLSVIAVALIKTFTALLIFSSILNIILSGLWNILPIYITELCEDHNRAKFGCLMTIFLPIGELYAFIIGPAFSYKNFTLLLAVPLIPFLLVFYFSPESPVYSLTKGRNKECSRALKKLRSNKTRKELETDICEIQKSIDLTNHTRDMSLMKLFNTKEGRMGVALGLMSMLGQLLCGVIIMSSLLAPILNKSNSNLSGNTIAILVGVAKIICSIITALVIEKIGRKKILGISSSVSGVAISALGVYYYLMHLNSPLVFKLQWVPLVAVLVYFVAFSFGLGPIPTVIISELFPPELRTVAFAFITTFIGIFFSLYSFAYPIIADRIGIHWCMWIFGAGCFLAAILIFFLLPETKGKSIAEIQEILKNY